MNKNPERIEELILQFDLARIFFAEEEEEEASIVTSLRDITERKQAEYEIDSLAKFPREDPNPVLRIAKDGTILFANKAAALLLNAWGSKVDQPLPESSRKFIQDVLSSGASRETEVECKDCTFSLTFAPIVDADYINVYGLDITERKRFEQLQGVIYKISDAINTTENIDDLFRSIHNHLSTIIDTTNVYIALYDEDKELISFPYFVDEKDSQLAPKKFGGGLTEYVIETGKAHYLTQESIFKLAEQGKIELFGIPSLIWLGVPLKIDSKIIGILALQSYSDTSIYTEKDLEILQYVSDQIAAAINRKRADEALRESEERFRFMAENTGDVLYRLKYDTMAFDYLSPAISILTGYTAEKINKIGFKRLIKQMIIPGVPDVLTEELTQKRNEGKTREWRAEYEILTKDGEEKWLGDHSFPWKDDSGKIVGSTGILQDITESKKAEDELQERLKELEIYYKATIGREGRIIELKQRVNELLVQLGKEKKYDV